MAVYKRSYHPYSGPLTPIARRWLVIARYSLATAFSTRISVIAFVLCLVPSIVSTLLIYFANNSLIQAALKLEGPLKLSIGSNFFLGLMQLEGWLAFFFTALIGPAIVGPDLSNNALPLYLSRPISRVQYIAGKFALLAGVLSAMTWVPMLLLVGLQAQLSATPWLRQNWFIVPAVFFGSWLWIAVLALVAMAVSAWVKWRIIAINATIAILLVPAGFGAVISGVLHTRWGFLLNVPFLMTLIWTDLLRVPFPPAANSVPVPAAWLAMASTAALSLFLLHRRIQARQVVRG
jgi:ABC-2 type transport system permease protein